MNPQYHAFSSNQHPRKGILFPSHSQTCSHPHFSVAPIGALLSCPALLNKLHFFSFSTFADLPMLSFPPGFAPRSLFVLPFCPCTLCFHSISYSVSPRVPPSSKSSVFGEFRQFDHTFPFPGSTLFPTQEPPSGIALHRLLVRTTSCFHQPASAYAFPNAPPTSSTRYLCLPHDALIAILLPNPLLSDSLAVSLPSAGLY